MESAVNKKLVPGSLFVVAISLVLISIGFSTQPAFADAISQERLEKQKRYLEMRERERAEKEEAKKRSNYNKAVKKKNCDTARGRLNNYKTARALYDYDKKGKKVYLSKADRKKAEKQAAADVRKWCK